MQIVNASRSSPTYVVDLEAPIFWLCGAITLLTFTLGSPMLNLLMPYSQAGGSFFAKFHPASWLGPPLLLLVWLDSAGKWRTPIGHLAWAIGLLSLLIAWLAMRGKGAMAATFIDIQLVPAILLLALSRLPWERVRSLLKVFIGLAAVNVLILVIEFASQRALLPREGHERFFRPAGLLAHPIMAGTIFYCAMFLTSRGVISTGFMRPLLALFLLGAALCGVRGPLTMATLIFLTHILRPAVPRRRLSDYVLDFGLLLLIPVGISALLVSGAFDRIVELGIWEQSAQSRFTIIDTIDLLSDRQFWSGVDGYDVSEFLANQVTGGRLIENAFVSVILLAGVPAAVGMAMTVLIVHAPAMRHSFVFTLMLIMVAATTLGFGAKNMIPAAIALSSYWAQRQFVERRRRSAATTTRANRHAMASHGGFDDLSVWRRPGPLRVGNLLGSPAAMRLASRRN
jgi:hypothetical protein